MIETEFEARVCKHLLCEYPQILALLKLTITSWPDRLAILPRGRVVFLEFKMNPKKYGLTPGQKEVKKYLTSNDYEYILCTRTGTAREVAVDIGRILFKSGDQNG